MVSKCANPLCGTPFRFILTGKLVMVYGWRPKPETLEENTVRKRERESEYCWLCDFEGNNRCGRISSCNFGTGKPGSHEESKCPYV
jgi:hypothetical protein